MPTRIWVPPVPRPPRRRDRGCTHAKYTNCENTLNGQRGLNRILHVITVDELVDLHALFANRVQKCQECPRPEFRQWWCSRAWRASGQCPRSILPGADGRLRVRSTRSRRECRRRNSGLREESRGSKAEIPECDQATCQRYTPDKKPRMKCSIAKGPPAQGIGTQSDPPRASNISGE